MPARRVFVVTAHMRAPRGQVRCHRACNGALSDEHRACAVLQDMRIVTGRVRAHMSLCPPESSLEISSR